VRVHMGLAITGALAAAAVLAASPGSEGQPAAPPAQTAQVQPQYSPAQLDQMLAPIALYPDELLGQILGAAGYPLEVVEADRWLEVPSNAALRGDELAAALDQQTWDPSVKSLAPFPQVLHMMDGQLDWTESLGEAFIADPSAVMDSVQRLRRQAEVSGKLRSNAEETVTDQDGVISIEPANSETVYIPDYEPTVVYDPWIYEAYPPFFFPDYFGYCVYDDFGYCWFPIPIIAPLWGWDHWDWRGHRLDIDRRRFTDLNGGRPPIGGDAWKHDPSHRLDVPYQQPALRSQFPGVAASPGAVHASRGYPPAAPAQVPSIAHVPPTYESYGEGNVVREQAERGASSRASTPSYQPRSPGGSSGRAPTSGRTGGRR